MITVLFGTESGNSEMAAEDIAKFIRDKGEDVRIIPMEDCDVGQLSQSGSAIIITSTYGEGELPETTQPFYDSLNGTRPNLATLRFGAFGLGDSTYETYGNGIDVVSALLRDLGAHQVGVTGRHDAAKGTPLAQAAVDWVDRLLPALSHQEA